MIADVKGKQLCAKTIFSNYCIVTLTFDLLTPDIHKAHPRLMASLHVKFHDDRCKGKAVMRQKPFTVIYAL